MPAAEMDSFQFSDHLDSEPEVALGLTAPRLGLAGLGAAAAWALTEMPVPAPVRLGAAALVALSTSTLAWGRVQGVSLARWSWLAARYAGRTLGARGGGGHAVDPDSTLFAGPQSGVIHRDEMGVAFLSLRPRTGCSSVCHAVGAELETLATTVWRSPGAGPVPNLVLYDWGAWQGKEFPGGRVIGLVLVWDGVEAYPGQLEAALKALRAAHPLAFLLAALNRAGPATHLSSRIAGGGARLVCSFPDQSLGASGSRPIEASPRLPAAAVRALADAIRGAANTW